MTARPLPLVDVVEATYCMDKGDEAWLEHILAAAAPCLDRGLGTMAYTFDASAAPVSVGSAVLRDSALTLADLAAVVGSADEAYVRDSWRTRACGTASEVPGFSRVPAVREIMHPHGARDVLAINACDVSGRGVWLGAWLPAVGQPTPADRAAWTRISAHLAAAFRLRENLSGRALEPDSAAAVLTASGRIEHAADAVEVHSAREALRHGVAALEKARGPLRRRNPTRAVDVWRVLNNARWSLVDYFERGGKRYVLAVENAPVANGPEALTERESQVVAHAAMGQSNKIIAYELGIADSTVRVLIARASAKLAAESRRELIAIYRAHERAGRS